MDELLRIRYLFDILAASTFSNVEHKWTSTGVYIWYSSKTIYHVNIKHTVGGCDHVIMFPIKGIQCHFRLANQMRSCLRRVEKLSTFLHSAQLVEHDDSSKVCCLSDVFVLVENRWVVFLWLQILSFNVWSLPQTIKKKNSYIFCVLITLTFLLHFVSLHFSSDNSCEIFLICASAEWFFISWSWRQCDFTLFL